MTNDSIGTSKTLALAELAEAGSLDAKSITRLQRRFGKQWADRIAIAASLQTKANRKFGPGVWWMTAKSLQQATPWQVARLKASWFGTRTVFDLCCGAGGDAIALAARGPVVAVDMDAELVEMAAANLAAVASPPQATVRCDDVTKIEIPAGVGIHIDPDRRLADRRTSIPEQYVPAWPQVVAIVSKSDCGVVKLAPAAKVDSSALPPIHHCWVALQGSVREQSLLWGAAIEHAGLRPHARSAIRLWQDGTFARFAPSDDELGCQQPVESTNRPKAVLIDPNAAVRAAGLTETFARRHRLCLLGQASGFLTADHHDTSLSQDLISHAVVGHVLWSGACDDRKLRREFRSRGVYPAIIKCRGTDHDPAVLTKRYRGCGDSPITLWIGRAEGRVYAAITAHDPGEVTD